MTRIQHTDTPSREDHIQFDQDTSHLQDWSRELIHLKAHGRLDLDDILSIQELNMDRNATYARLETMGLATVPYRTTSLARFLSAPEEYLATFKDCKVRLVVEPHCMKESLATIRLTDPVHTDIVRLLNEKIDVRDCDAYSVLIKEFIPFAYRVTVVVNSDQSIVLEAANPSSKSFQLNGMPDYQARRDPFLGTYNYDFDKPQLRSLFYHAINKIPHIGTGRDKEFQIGYYEMIIAKRSESAPFGFYFDDYRKGKGFNK